MKKNNQDIAINELAPYEICLLEGEVIRITDFSDDLEKEEYTIKAFTPKVEYNFTKSELSEIETTYNNFYTSDGNSDTDLFLYEGMIGTTKRDIIYPGLDSCIGITIILNDFSKIGAHFVLPMGNYKSAERYIRNIKYLFNVLKNSDSKVCRVEVSGKKGIPSIAEHIENLAFSIIFLDIINTYIKPLFELAELKIGRNDKNEVTIINYVSKNSPTNSELEKIVASREVCVIKYNF